jgi:hypothetical protein
MSSTVSNNGKARRSLATELDRLDQMLDGLANGLNEAVGDAVKAALGGGMHEMVRAVLTELFNSPETLAKLRAVLGATPAGAALPVPARRGMRKRLCGLWSGIRACARKLRQACAARVRLQWGRVCSTGKGIRQALVVVRNHLPMARPFRRQILTAFAFGLGMGVLAWFAGPWLASFASGFGGFTIALAAQAGLWFWRMLRRTQSFMHADKYMA